MIISTQMFFFVKYVFWIAFVIKAPSYRPQGLQPCCLSETQESISFLLRRMQGSVLLKLYNYSSNARVCFCHKKALRPENKFLIT